MSPAAASRAALAGLKTNAGGSPTHEQIPNVHRLEIPGRVRGRCRGGRSTGRRGIPAWRLRHPRLPDCRPVRPDGPRRREALSPAHVILN